jgi:ubiquinone/menaquinone biosynthesis C-methylase UbiE
MYTLSAKAFLGYNILIMSEKFPNKELTETQSAELALSSERGLLEYTKELRLPVDALIEKKVLDLGSGPTAKFAQDVEKDFPGTKVVSLDHSFEERDRTDFAYFPTEETKKGAENVERIPGLFTTLPFKDEAFDTVVSSAAMPLYLTTLGQVEEAFKEVIRVLKMGGKAYIGPVTYTDVIDTDPKKMIYETHVRHSYEESKVSFKKILEKFKDEIEFEFFPAETAQRLNRYFAEMETIVIKTPVLIISKKANGK